MSEIRNSEILFIYEAKLCNPNGDPDDENRPRMDPRTNINLVSDVRLKRFFRNYILDYYGDEYLWVTTVDGKHVDATDRYFNLKDKLKIERAEEILAKCIDARLFGAVIPIKEEKAKKKSDASEGESETQKSASYTGPVQFSWGFSLHPVELVDSASITSVFKGRETKEEAGTIGKDWRLYYSLIAFYGVVSGKRAEGMMVRDLDLQILDNFLWNALSEESTTRSKLGHKPHLYIRLEHKANTFIGDFRKYLRVDYDQSKPIRSMQDLHLDFSQLADKIKDAKSMANLYLRESDEMKQLVASKFKESGLQYAPLPHAINVSKENIVATH